MPDGSEKIDPDTFPRVSGDEPATVQGFPAGRDTFPRVSGDEPKAEQKILHEEIFPPRERG